MKGSMKIFKLWGIEVKLHYSWWFVFALLAYSLSADFFPYYYPGMEAKIYWLMGITASLLLFVSVLLHELTHSLVAKSRKIKVESITLFFFGGVASLPTEEMKPWTEFWMALAGPAFSLALAGVFYFLNQMNSNLFLTAISFYLYQLNLILALFNLLPGFPLDGGRIFRSLLAAYFKDAKKATWIAAKGGKFVGGVLAFLGILLVVQGLWNGLWFIFLGGFLWFVAGLSYEQVAVQEVLSKIPLAKLVKKSYTSFEPTATFDKVIKRYVESGEENFIVKKGQKFLGMIDLQRIGRLDRTEWRKVLVSSVVIPSNKLMVLSDKDTAFTALKRMAEQKLRFLPLIRKGKMVGVVYNRSLIHRLNMKLRYGL